MEINYSIEFESEKACRGENWKKIMKNNESMS